MLKFAPLAAVAAIALAAPAQAATTITLEESGNTLTGEFTGHVDVAGDFSREYTFDLPMNGRTVGSIITIAVDAASNIDFSSVTLNGHSFNLSGTGQVESGSISLATVAGPQSLIVNGTSGTNGGFSGTISFTAVPEPGIWALMILGFGLMGGAMRRRSYQINRVRTNVNFA